MFTVKNVRRQFAAATLVIMGAANTCYAPPITDSVRNSEGMAAARHPYPSPAVAIIACGAIAGVRRPRRGVGFDAAPN